MDAEALLQWLREQKKRAEKVDTLYFEGKVSAYNDVILFLMSETLSQYAQSWEQAKNDDFQVPNSVILKNDNNAVQSKVEDGNAGDQRSSQ